MSHPSNAAATGASHEVTFDGRYYHFRQYRYERLDDALRYAAAQQCKPGYRPDPAFVPQWLPAWAPDMAQRATMRELAIGFDAGRFCVGSYRYDRLDDAIAFARLVQGGRGVP